MRFRDVPNRHMTAVARRIQQRWPAGPRAVPLARHVAGTFAADMGADPGLCHRIELAVSEATTNAVVHAYRDGRGPGEVVLEARVEDERLDVEITDDGMGLTPRRDSPGLGLGLAMIGTLADRLDIGRPPHGGTRLCMTFGLGTAERAVV